MPRLARFRHLHAMECDSPVLIWLAPRNRFLAALCVAALASGWPVRANATEPETEFKVETFDRDPEWEGINHRLAQSRSPIDVRQDFGYSAASHRAGGRGAGEIGGFITPTSEAAYYAQSIPVRSLTKPLEASGRLRVEPGGTHVLLGFFNSRTLKEWRTPNTLAIRINGRGDIFFAYVEYCTSKWRAGGDTKPFPATTDPVTRRWSLLGFPCEPSWEWSLRYDPQARNGRGLVTARIGEHTAECELDEGHQADGASFDRFGLLNVMKSVDSGSAIWLDDVSVLRGDVETFDRDPPWEGRGNRLRLSTRLVRPWFDFGFSSTQFAGGRGRGELGGCIFRGDCRERERMAAYGDRVGPLTLETPLRAEGRVVLRRGVSDSTTLFGFYNSVDSLRRNDSQSDGIPASVLGVHIEGPSSEGFKFYPVVRAKTGGGHAPNPRAFPTIAPDSRSHRWALEYDPSGAAGRGRIQVTLDDAVGGFDLAAGERARGAMFDRFGIVTSWIDGNSQDVYWDDLKYTIRSPRASDR